METKERIASQKTILDILNFMAVTPEMMALKIIYLI